VPRIPEKVIEDVRLASDIVDVIGSYLPLKKAGGNSRALCPFHKEKTPSFNVNPQRQIFKCFGCGVGGNVFHFVMRYENVDYPTAIRLLAERAGIKIQFSDQPHDAGAEAQKDLLYRLHDEVCSFFQNQLARAPEAEVARRYVVQRGVSPDMVTLFRIGYAPNSWDATLQWALSRKYKPELLEAAGLCIRREEGSGRYDRFRGRLMFPICNEQGKVVGFSGRVLDPEAKEAKYVNSPDTPIFHKSRILFALDKAKRAILEAKHAVVCEGQLDTIACHQAGIQHVVAPQGTAFTETQGRILKRYVDEVVLCFDSDAAGQNAAARSVDVWIEAGLIVQVAEVPAGHDPDSLLKKEGAEAMRVVLSGARSYFDFHLDWLCRQHDPKSDRGKVAISRAVAETLVKIPNAALQASTLQKAALRLGVREDDLRIEVNRVRQSGRPGAAADEAAEQAPLIAKVSATEKLLLELMLADKEVVALCGAELDRALLGGNVAGDFIREVLAMHDRGAWKDHVPLLEGERSPEQLAFLTELLSGEPRERDGKKLASDCLRSLEKARIQAEIEQLKARQHAPGISFEENLALTKEILDLNQRLRHIPALPAP
jgi:DNA primase